MKRVQNVSNKFMWKNYLTVALRNLRRGKLYSFINLIGLSTGMAAAMLIGLWVYDELTFDHYHANIDRIAQVWQSNIYNGERTYQVSNPALMAEELRSLYGSDFKNVQAASWDYRHLVSAGEKKIFKSGMYVEPKFAEMFSLKMLAGDRAALKGTHAIFLSATTAAALFGEENAIGKTIRLDNQYDLDVVGVYEDLPNNSTFDETNILLPWELYMTNEQVKSAAKFWGNNFTQTFVELAEGAAFESVSAKIKDVRFNRGDDDVKKFKPEVFLHLMSRWHLYSAHSGGGRITLVWLFGMIGVFVLLLACINVMNLSTARSEKRAKEVGIRKSIGSLRHQLVAQFFSESILVTLAAFVVGLILVQGVLPMFNSVAQKAISVPFGQIGFWLIGFGFALLTGVAAGFYPAVYLSGFDAVNVLKGTFRAGRSAARSRQALVVVQFIISIVLIIGTLVVFQQIQFAKNRPLGYEQSGLITVQSGVDELYPHLNAIRDELQTSGAIREMAASSGSITNAWRSSSGFEWKGKDPSFSEDFPNDAVSFSYGKTVGWQFVQGRDFSAEMPSDSAAIVINESLAAVFKFENPIGETVRWNQRVYTIIGVIHDVIAQSPYRPVSPTLYLAPTASLLAQTNGSMQTLFLKLNPDKSAGESLEKIKDVFTRFAPAVPFAYQFVELDYARKFRNEQRIATLAAAFAALAILISYLGIFGLASFTAEQRTKEIGVRKVLGASVGDVWVLLSKDFVWLVAISFIIAAPIAFAAMNEWLQSYTYRATLSWHVFMIAGAGVLLITLLTVSVQALKVARQNPVKSLRYE
jgi:putative ABC transport system permease protein